MNYLPKYKDVITSGVESSSEVWKPVAEKFVNYIFNVRDNSVPQIVEISDYSLETIEHPSLIQNGNDGQWNTFSFFPKEVDWESADVLVWPDGNYTVTLNSKEMNIKMKSDKHGRIVDGEGEEVLMEKKKLFHVYCWSKKDGAYSTPDDNVIYLLAKPENERREKKHYFYQMRKEEDEWKLFDEGSLTKSSR